MTMDKEIFQQQHVWVKSDNAFTRKARLLQSIRREESGAEIGVRVFGDVEIPLGNLAKDGEAKNYNFLTDEIFAYAKWRVENKKPYETIEEKRLFCNFLSSQPMAFNLFWPLMEMVRHSEDMQVALAGVMRSILDPDDRLGIARIEEVGLEYIPPFYKDCLNDKTAMDAYMVYLRQDGKRGIIAIETKYTDTLGMNEGRHPEYARAAAQRIGYLFEPAALDGLLSGRQKITQVYRNFLLTETVREHKGYADSLSIVLAPRENVSNRAEEDMLMGQIRDEYRYKFQTVVLETFVQVMIERFPGERIFEEFRRRYLEFL